jgi:hypothetical protein
LNKRILAFIVAVWACFVLVSCGGGSGGNATVSGLNDRVLASQEVTSALSIGSLVIVNGWNDTLPRAAPIQAGNSPGLMAISPSRNFVAVFDASGKNIWGINTLTEKAIGDVNIPGLTQSIIVPTSSPVAYAAIPGATLPGFEFTGAVSMVNLQTQSILTIAVPQAQTVVSDSTGTTLLVFSNGSDFITLLNPALASPPVDTSCLQAIPNQNSPNAVCTIISEPMGSRPVYAIVNGETAYVFNCGYECGGVTSSGAPAVPSIAVLNLSSLTVTATIQVNGATYGLLNESTLYVAGLGTPTGPTCASLTNPINPKTAATYCGTLDIVNLSTMTDPYYNNASAEIAIPDGFHNQMDLSFNGQLFVGSKNCTNIGDEDNPSGEVRGCLAIYNTNSNALIIPPDNGDVDGLQGFTTRYIEYVAEGGNLRVYDTQTGTLYINSQYLPQGSIDIVGYVGDVKAIDFF